jgi:hypothetical protein
MAHMFLVLYLGLVRDRARRRPLITVINPHFVYPGARAVKTHVPNHHVRQARDQQEEEWQWLQQSAYGVDTWTRRRGPQAVYLGEMFRKVVASARANPYSDRQLSGRDSDTRGDRASGGGHGRTPAFHGSTAPRFRWVAAFSARFVGGIDIDRVRVAGAAGSVGQLWAATACLLLTWDPLHMPHVTCHPPYRVAN